MSVYFLLYPKQICNVSQARTSQSVTVPIEYVCESDSDVPKRILNGENVNALGEFLWLYVQYSSLQCACVWQYGYFRSTIKNTVSRASLETVLNTASRCRGESPAPQYYAPRRGFALHRSARAKPVRLPAEESPIKKRFTQVNLFFIGRYCRNEYFPSGKKSQPT